MNAKLTLSLDRDIIEQAKEFAGAQHKSLSKLIEGYLRQATSSNGVSKQITPLVAKLSGVIDARQLGDLKSGYGDYLSDKYR
ncbi:MAG: DUF6364 family protein [Deltaproteobacteria bacterium]